MAADDACSTLDIAFQAYQFALDAVRASERARAEEGLTEEEFNWRVTRRMQDDQNLGREYGSLQMCD